MSRFERLFVWSGGALFVLSLAACAYAYLVTWAAPGRGGNAGDAFRSGAIDVALFSVFALHHSVFAREPVKKRIGRVLPERLVRSFFVWAASLLLLWVLAFWQPVAGGLYAVGGWRAAAHAAVQIGGLWLIARSVARIDPLELAGIKPPSGREALQIGGPYRLVRHPLYLGWLLAVFGAAHMTNDRLVFAAISTAYLIVAIPWEERSLLRLFGEPYARYQEAVRWRLVPFIY